MKTQTKLLLTAIGILSIAAPASIIFLGPSDPTHATSAAPATAAADPTLHHQVQKAIDAATWAPLEQATEAQAKAIALMERAGHTQSDILAQKRHWDTLLTNRITQDLERDRQHREQLHKIQTEGIQRDLELKLQAIEQKRRLALSRLDAGLDPETGEPLPKE